MVKLAFIIDDSEAFLRTEAMNIAEEWGFGTDSLVKTTEFSYTTFRSPVTLFGGVNITHLDLYDKNDLRAFVSLIDNNKKNKYFDGKWFGAGLIITTKHAQGSKKIEKLVESSGGQVIKKAKPGEMRKKLLGRLNLNKQTYEHVNDFVGEDYDMLISVVNEVEKLDKDDQAKLTIDELLIRLPATPGAIPPWEYVDAMLSGNIKKAVSLYERTVINTHPLVPLVFARRNIELIYRIVVLRSTGMWNSKEIAATLGERNGPGIWNADKVAKRISLNTAEQVAKLTAQIDTDLKGGLNVDPKIAFVNYIVHVGLLLR